MDKAIAAATKHGFTVLTRTDIQDRNRAARDAVPPGTTVTIERLMEDRDRTFEPGTLGEAKLKRSDAGILIERFWGRGVECTPVAVEKIEHTGWERSTAGPSTAEAEAGVRIDPQRQSAAVTKAQNAWEAEQWRLVVAEKASKAEVTDLLTEATIAALRNEAAEDACRFLDVELLTTERQSYAGNVQLVKDHRGTLLAEIEAGGARRLRALKAVAIALVVGYYGEPARELVARLKEDHGYVPFDADAFLAEWQPIEIARLERKKAKEAAPEEADKGYPTSVIAPPAEDGGELPDVGQLVEIDGQPYIVVDEDYDEAVAQWEAEQAVHEGTEAPEFDS
jgi:hypothetical protein